MVHAEGSVILHVGSEQKIHADYTNNGGTQVLYFHGGAENFPSLSYIAIPPSVWQTMSALALNGVLGRFPRLTFSAIEPGGL